MLIENFFNRFFNYYLVLLLYGGSMKKNVLYYFGAFLIPIIIFIVLCFISDLYPFGKYLLNLFDSSSMYPSLIIEYINNLKTGSSIFYTFHAGLGTNFISLINLYVGSPLNLLFAFFKTNQIYLFYAILIYIKMGLSSLCLYIYFNNKNSKKNNINLLFSCIYALSSFLVVYNYHIMWSDAFYLAPLILLGIDKLIDNNNSKLYIIFLTLSIIINFYTAFMVCIFSLLYFIYRIVEIKNRKRIILKFIKSSLLCAFFSAFILIPSAIALLNGRNPNFSNYISFNLPNLKSLFYNLLPGSFIETDNFNDGSCVICASIFALVLLILYFFNTNISKKQKIVTFSIIIFLLMSLIFNPIDYFWNMFTKPIWWNSRYSFLIILFIIIIAYESYINIKYIKIKPIIQSVLLLIFITLFLVSFSLKLYGTGQKNKTLIILLLSLIFFGIYYYLIPKNNKLRYLIYPLIVIEIVFNGYYLLNITERYKIKDINIEMKEKKETLETISNKKQDFYRIYDYNDSQTDDGLFYSYNSATLFASIYNKNVNEFYSKKLVLNDYNDDTINHTQIALPNIETLSLLNIKYIMSYDYKTNLECFNQKYCINKYVLPVGFLINNKKSIKLIDNESLNNIEKIYSYLNNKNTKLYYEQDYKIKSKNLNLNKSIIKSKKKNNGQLTLNFKANIDGILAPNVSAYVYLDNYNIYINNEKIQKNMFMNVKKNDKVKIVYKYSEDDGEVDINNLKLKIMDLKVFENVVYNLSSNPLKVTTSKKHLLEGNINNMENNKKLFLTIPYEKGLIVKVDDKKVNINKEFGTFISINLSKGKHKITIDYFPEGLKIGILIYLGSFIVYLFSIKREKHQKTN